MSSPGVGLSKGITLRRFHIFSTLFIHFLFCQRVGLQTQYTQRQRAKREGNCLLLAEKLWQCGSFHEGTAFDEGGD